MAGENIVEVEIDGWCAIVGRTPPSNLA